MVAFAQSSCDMQISPKIAGVGERINVTIEFSSENMDIDSATATLSYNPEIIEIAEDSPLTGSGGLVDLSANAGDAPVVKFDIVFVAKKQGSTTISVSDTNTFTADGSFLGSPKAENTINIGEESGLEADSKLKALEVSKGQLSPAFSPETLLQSVSLIQMFRFSFFIFGRINISDIRRKFDYSYDGKKSDTLAHALRFRCPSFLY